LGPDTAFAAVGAACAVRRVDLDRSRLRALLVRAPGSVTFVSGRRAWVSIERALSLVLASGNSFDFAGSRACSGPDTGGGSCPPGVVSG
jgi:hypothetical protein